MPRPRSGFDRGYESQLSRHVVQSPARRVGKVIGGTHQPGVYSNFQYCTSTGLVRLIDIWHSHPRDRVGCDRPQNLQVISHHPARPLGDELTLLERVNDTTQSTELLQYPLRL
jgi:hypothetical protein